MGYSPSGVRSRYASITNTSREQKCLINVFRGTERPPRDEEKSLMFYREALVLEADLVEFGSSRVTFFPDKVFTVLGGGTAPANILLCGDPRATSAERRC